MNWRDLSIVRKLGFLLAFNTVIAVLSIALVFTVGTAFKVYQGTQEKLHALASVIGENSRAALSFDDPESARTMLDALHAQPDISAARLFGRQGEVFVAADFSGHHYHEASVLEQLIYVVFPARLTVSHEVVDEGQPIGRIELEAHLYHIWVDLLKGLGLMALIAAGLAGLSIFFGLRLRKIVSTPILNLAAISHRVYIEQDYSIRAIKTGQDEIGALVDDFNRMLAEIQGRDEALRRERESLELRVEQRTADLDAARIESERANRAKSDFLSSMSHELRTPMNAILGFAQLMEYDEKLHEDHLDSVREILKAGHHLLSLINEVLDLAKVESGRIELSLEAVEVLPLVEECVGLVRTLADGRGIRIHYTNIDEAAVRADRTRLKQALLNLLSNAIKYNHEGGSVTIDVQPADKDRLCIRVTDTGSGIPSERFEQLFQPFNRLDRENSAIEGTGIGLTITLRIVELMGGTVKVESEVGVGSRFQIELPLESMNENLLEIERALGDLPEDQTEFVESRHEAALHTVLYIEDNPSNIRLVAQILGRRKHLHLLTAHTPELGIELARAHHPDLILLDINMPGMDGYQVLEVFKADPLVMKTPVVAVTANAMPQDIKRGMAAGFVEYLTKPLDVGRFMQVVDAMLSQDGASKAAHAHDKGSAT